MSDNPPDLTGAVDCAAYRDGRRVPGTRSPEGARAAGGFAWVGLFEPSTEDLDRVIAAFGLPARAVDRALAGRRRPRLERFGDVVVVVLKTVRHTEVAVGEIVETGDVVVVLGDGVVVTVRHGEHSEIGRVRAGLEAAPERLALGPAAVLHAVVEHLVADYLAATAVFDRHVDQVEELVFAPRRPVDTELMYLLKREIVELHRSVAPLPAILRLLLGDDTPEPAQVDTALRTLVDDVETLGDRITRLDAVLTTLLSATVAKVGVEQNEDMRRIGAWLAIVSVPTMVAGTYGMNFDNMPELGWTYGRPIILALTLTLCVFLHRTFKRNQWL